MCAALFALLFDVLFISCLSDLKVKQPAKGKKRPFIAAKGAQLCKLGWQSCPALPEGSVCLHLPGCSALAEELLSPSPECLPSSESKALTFCDSWAQSLFHVSVYQNQRYWGWEGERGSSDGNVTSLICARAIAAAKEKHLGERFPRAPFDIGTGGKWPAGPWPDCSHSMTCSGWVTVTIKLQSMSVVTCEWHKTKAKLPHLACCYRNTGCTRCCFESICFAWEEREKCRKRNSSKRNLNACLQQI